MAISPDSQPVFRFWDSDNFDLDDGLNKRIWEQSVALQSFIQPQQELLAPGAVGAQQAMVHGEPLPWVPDIVGKDSMGPDGVLIVGSAYAGFIREHSRRNKSNNSLPLHEYRSARSAAEFQIRFLRSVVQEDPDYYQKIQRRASKQWHPRQIAVFDLCRVSFVRRGDVSNQLDKSGDTIVRAAPAIFTRYVEHPKAREWTWQRIVSSEATKIIALGTIAEHGLLRIFDFKQMTILDDTGIKFTPARSTDGLWVKRYADGKRKLRYWEERREQGRKAGWTITGFVNGKQRSWTLCPRYHPAAQIKG